MEKTFYSVAEAAELLTKEGILKGKYADQSVRRLIRLGELKAERPPENQPKVGHQIYKKSLDEYIEIGKMNVTELRKELLKIRRELESLRPKKNEVIDEIIPGQTSFDDIEQEEGE